MLHAFIVDLPIGGQMVRAAKDTFAARLEPICPTDFMCAWQWNWSITKGAQVDFHFTWHKNAETMKKPRQQWLFPNKCQRLQPKPPLWQDKQGPPLSVNTEGVDQMLISVEVPGEVSNRRGMCRVTKVIKRYLNSLARIAGCGETSHIHSLKY